MSWKSPAPGVSSPVEVVEPSRRRLLLFVVVLSSRSVPPASVIAPLVCAPSVAVPVKVRLPAISTSLSICNVPVSVCTLGPRTTNRPTSLPVPAGGPSRTVPANVPAVSAVTTMSSLAVLVPATALSTFPTAPLSVPARSSLVQVSVGVPAALAGKTTGFARSAVRPESALLLKRKVPASSRSAPSQVFCEGAFVAGSTGNVPKRNVLVPDLVRSAKPEMPRLKVTTPAPSPPSASPALSRMGVSKVNPPALFCVTAGASPESSSAPPAMICAGSVASAAAFVALSVRLPRMQGVTAMSLVAV